MSNQRSKGPQASNDTQQASYLQPLYSTFTHIIDFSLTFCPPRCNWKRASKQPLSKQTEMGARASGQSQTNELQIGIEQVNEQASKKGI